jgi:hypothetical protein
VSITISGDFHWIGNPSALFPARLLVAACGSGGAERSAESFDLGAACKVLFFDAWLYLPACWRANPDVESTYFPILIYREWRNRGIGLRIHSLEFLRLGVRGIKVEGGNCGRRRAGHLGQTTALVDFSLNHYCK